MKLIYRLFLDGYTFHSIARELTARGLETPAKKKRWYPRTVESILTNEKYKGDALLQKRFTVNFLTKESKANEGEVPQYYVENNHEAIISPQVFAWVQEEIKRRREGKGRYSGVSIFSSKIKCGQCGGWYGAKVWHSTDMYRRTIYRCNDKFKSHCKTPHLTEDDIKEAFVRAANRLIENKADVLDSITLLKERLTQGPEPPDGQLHQGASGAGTHQGVRCPAVGQPGGLHHGVQQRRYPGDLQGRDGNQSISRKKGLRQRIQEETQDSLPYF